MVLGKDDVSPKRKDDLEISGPFGWSVRANGREVVGLLMLVIGVGVLAYMIRDHDLRANERLEAAITARQTQLNALSAQQLRLQESMEEMIYVMSLTQEERVKLKIEMPVSLRARLLISERAR